MAGPRTGPGQPDRRTHRLQRGLRAPDGDRSGGVDRPASAEGAGRRRPCRGLRRPARFRVPLPTERGGRPWGEYVKGVAWSLIEAGHTLAGWEGVVAGDVPIGAGLSSSAALEGAAARACAAAAGLAWGAA